jgi:hypothetical protein
LAAVIVTSLAGQPLLAQQPAPPPPPPFRPNSPAVPQPQALVNAQAATPNYQVINPTPQNPNPYSSQWGNYNPWGTNIQTPLNGYLTGAADVTNANAQYQLTIQQARLQQEVARQAASDTRMKIAQERRYMASLEPTPEEVRQKSMMDELNRARNNPPAMDIWSGTALNALLMAIQKAQSAGIRGPAVPLQQDTLEHINLTTGVTNAGAGILRNLERFAWPAVLRTAAFKNPRDSIEKFAQQAVQQAASGPVDAETVKGLTDGVAAMELELKNRVADLTPTEYVQGMRYLRELKGSFRTLDDPNAAAYLKGKFRAQGNNVAELVAFMSANGLRFAPAVSGDEPAYTALHRAMTTYDYQVGLLASR